MFCEPDFLKKTAQNCWRPGGLELTRHGLALCNFPKRARIADIGCGMGASVRMLRQDGYSCIGLEKNLQATDIPQIQGQAEALPFAKESLHGILCECVLSLLQNPGRILRNFWEVCRFDGSLLLTDLYIKKGESPSSGGPFSRQKLENTLSEAGWQVAHFEDHSKALKEFAANLLWYEKQDEVPWSQNIPGGDIPWRDCGYGLWIAQKERL